jgi:hypothetical protein
MRGEGGCVWAVCPVCSWGKLREKAKRWRILRNECGMPGSGTPEDERGGVIFQCDKVIGGSFRVAVLNETAAVKEEAGGLGFSDRSASVWRRINPVNSKIAVTFPPLSLMRPKCLPRLQQSFQSRKNPRPPIRVLSIRRIVFVPLIVRHHNLYRLRLRSQFHLHS